VYQEGRKVHVTALKRAVSWTKSLVRIPDHGKPSKEISYVLASSSREVCSTWLCRGHLSSCLNITIFWKELQILTFIWILSSVGILNSFLTQVDMSEIDLLLDIMYTGSDVLDVNSICDIRTNLFTPQSTGRPVGSSYPPGLKMLNSRSHVFWTKTVIFVENCDHCGKRWVQKQLSERLWNLYYFLGGVNCLKKHANTDIIWKSDSDWVITSQLCCNFWEFLFLRVASCCSYYYNLWGGRQIISTTYIQTAAKKSPKQKTNLYTTDNLNKNDRSVVA
jgi:hypothetical protein